MGGAMMSQPAMQVPTLPQAGVAYPSYPSYSGMPQGLPVQPQMSANPYTGGGVSGVPVSVLPSQAVGSGVVESYSVVDRMLALAAKQEREGQPWQAIHTYRQALQLEPHNRSALLSYARMKHRAGDFDGAIILYGQILRYHALDPVALNDLGLCFARKGDLAQALDSLQKATQQRPDDKRYRNNLAIVLVESGRNQEALDQMQIAHGPAIANYNLAALLLRRGQAAEARQCLESAILHDPSFQPAMELLASLDDAPPSERIASREMGIPGGGLKGSPTRSSSKPPLGSNDAIEQPILIAPQSAELPEKLSTSVLQPAVWQEPAKAMPPSVEDYQISGLSEFE
jgi:Flp pilus assembly protein TadD